MVPLHIAVQMYLCERTDMYACVHALTPLPTGATALHQEVMLSPSLTLSQTICSVVTPSNSLQTCCPTVACSSKSGDSSTKYNTVITHTRIYIYIYTYIYIMYMYQSPTTNGRTLISQQDQNLTQPPDQHPSDNTVYKACNVPEAY